ncbi:MAG: hypothetical protein JWO94_3774 [Verrucomicrobiaceae bacterium]|nr:hypothetical protein [Verrucomicrobiaceae bacterium]
MKALLLCFLLSQGLRLASAAEPAAAMWVYHTEALLPEGPERTELFAFCEERHIGDLFWATHFQGHGRSQEIARAAELHAFVKAASAHGLRIHALTGDPSHVLEQNHDRVLERVDAAIEFNHASPEDERLAGVHFDIEPHGLSQWKEATLEGKCALLTQFVEVNVKACERLRARAPHMQFGTDITFWFDKPGPDSEPVYPVTFHGVTKDATKHLLDVADNVGIMSYRNTAEGKNGIIDLVTKTITYADTAKGRAYVGVKMANIGPPMEGFYGQTEAAMQEALKPVAQVFAGHRGYAGIAYFMYGAYRDMPAK